MKLIVGLGNPGVMYDKTRHNMGFAVIDAFAKKHDVLINKNKFNGLYASFDYNGENVYLLKPQSYMNLSGEVVKSFLNYYKIDVSDVLIISDDLDLPFLKVKFKESGSSGGHNGLKNIELNLGTSAYKRMKIGISNDKNADTKDYVLGKLDANSIEELNAFCLKASDMLDDYLSISFERLMNKYN